jgi:ribosomal protein L7Ae-like RNA K-turn-binding protein
MAEMVRQLSEALNVILVYAETSKELGKIGGHQGQRLICS